MTLPEALEAGVVRIAMWHRLQTLLIGLKALGPRHAVVRGKGKGNLGKSPS